jgi:hypothetical protein
MTAIDSPKVLRVESVGRASWYPYYAGFSPAFAAGALRSLELPKGARLLDPWNGAGTTSQAACEAGLDPLGFDINPAMVVIAKARLLDTNVRGSLRVLGTRIAQKARADTGLVAAADDPLHNWFSPSGANGVRALERAIRYYLVASVGTHNTPTDADQLSSLAAFYYVALFRTVRQLLRRFQTSNPTWLRIPGTPARIRPRADAVVTIYGDNVRSMAASMGAEGRTASVLGPTHARIAQGDSRTLALEAGSIDGVLTSPPYCTRLDYAVATRPELAVLGYGPAQFRTLRESMLGTAAIASTRVDASPRWGPSCNRLLELMAKHKSKASATYYLKTHLQYFDGLYNSLAEIHRVSRLGAPCTFVVQDSHYKEIHNDLAQITIEMSSVLGLSLKSRREFAVVNILAASHPHIRSYRPKITAQESVLTFTKVA